MKKNLQIKMRRLLQIQNQLKTEFVGIDNQIEVIIEKIKNWYIYPEFHEHPLIICLWGMTGVGKTSLLNRLMELIELQKSFFLLDMGDRDLHYHAQSKFGEISKMARMQGQVVLNFDEFQLASTVDKDGKEKSGSSVSRIFWSILDTGIFSYLEYTDEVYQLSYRVSQLKQLLLDGVIVENGMVIEGKNVFEEYLKRKGSLTRRHFPNGDEEIVNFNYQFVQDDDWSLITKRIDLDADINDFSIKQNLASLNGVECIRYFETLIDKLRKPTIVDCRKSLIFISGNLDEAYEMFGDMDADIDADVIHKSSMKINPADILQALSKRFRVEQIARLGNNHIIYPSLSRKDFERYIEIKTTEFEHWCKEKFGFVVRIQDCVKTYIYSEGVNPVLGIRPLKNVVYDCLNKYMPDVSELFNAEKQVFEVCYTVRKTLLVLQALSIEGDLILQSKHTLTPHTSLLRKKVTENELALTCVHEAGHIVAHIEQFKKFPVSAASLSRSAFNKGFVLGEPIPIYSKSILKKKIAVNLAGYLTEEIFFGKENISVGAADDISNATSLATDYFKKYGFGESVASFYVESVNTNHKLFDTDYKLNIDAKSLIENIRIDTRKMLLENKDLILAYAKALFKKYKLNQADMIEIYKEHRELDNGLFSDENSYFSVLMGKSIANKTEIKK